jgi:H+/gluconate symporter-like permease
VAAASTNCIGDGAASMSKRRKQTGAPKISRRKRPGPATEPRAETGDVSSEIVRAPTTGAPSAAAFSSSNQDAQRLLSSILSTIGSVIVPKLATGIIGMLQQKRRELGLPEQRDAASMERDLQSVLSSLLPALVQAVPMIASSLSGQPAPRSPEEESQRFLPFLAAVVPALISAAPKIISAFNRQRGVESAEPSISSPEVADRFIGPLLQTLVPQLLQSAPSILGSIFRGGHRRVDNGQKP